MNFSSHHLCSFPPDNNIMLKLRKNLSIQLYLALAMLYRGIYESKSSSISNFHHNDYLVIIVSPSFITNLIFSFVWGNGGRPSLMLEFPPHLKQFFCCPCEKSTQTTIIINSVIIHAQLFPDGTMKKPHCLRMQPHHSDSS